MLQDRMVVGGSMVIKGKWQEKSKKVVESKENSNKGSNSRSNNGDDMPLAPKCTASPASATIAKQQKTTTSKEGEGEQCEEDVEMREGTPLVTVAKVEMVLSRGKSEGEQEVKEEVIDVEKGEDSNEEGRI
ncbi:hypothetical protein J132_00458 [Termitomyces sp. J132]|nr:hypothetical protein J132_00068 [Termitomyces sp. J132]KNZ81492.1 hypothetical protein J132_00458 [Termitomyces sp. J132]